MPTLNKGSIPKITVNEPKINFGTLPRKSSDQVMSEPTVGGNQIDKSKEVKKP